MSGANITDFVVEFDQLSHKLAQFDMKLPDGVLAFFLLSAENVSEESEKLARATCKKLTYADMKATILKLFADPAGDDEVGAPAIKQEPVFKTEHKSVVNRERFDKEEIDVYQRLLWPGQLAQKTLYRIMDGLPKSSWYLDTA